MSMRQSVVDGRFDRRLIHHPLTGALPHSPPHYGLIQQPIQYSGTSVQYHHQHHHHHHQQQQQQHLNLYDHHHHHHHHQFIPTRNVYGETPFHQEVIQNRERSRILLFPEGNFPFFSNVPVEPEDATYDEDSSRQKILSSPLRNPCNWSNCGKDSSKDGGILYNRNNHLNDAGDGGGHGGDCGDDHGDDVIYTRADQLSPEVRNVTDGGLHLKQSYQSYRDTDHHNPNHPHHTHHMDELPGQGKIVNTVPAILPAILPGNIPPCDPMPPECSTANPSTIAHNNNSNNSSINNNNNSSPPANKRADDSKVHLQPPWNWMKKQPLTSTPSPGKTRTKDKYRIVYTELQKVELEKEFLYNQYINLQRKSELAACIGLTDRQVKIWFQNRRAKDRKSRRKHEQMTRTDQELAQPYPGTMGDHFGLGKGTPMDGFCHSQREDYEFPDIPHSTFFEGSQVGLKEVSNMAPLQRHLL